MCDHTHLKWYYQFEEIFDANLQAQNQLADQKQSKNHCSFRDIAKVLQTCYFGYFGQA